MAVFNTCSDIMKVCYELYDPNFRVKREVRPDIPKVICGWRGPDLIRAPYRT